VSTYELIYPDGYEERSWEYKAKGWVSGVVLSYKGEEYVLNVYELERLRQDIEDELQGSPVFFESNLIVVSSVDKSSIQAAIERLIGRGEIGIGMCPSRNGVRLSHP
jgi:hypothetical protein